MTEYSANFGGCKLTMTRKILTAVLLLLALTVLAGLCEAEETPATPTDLECAHEHTDTVIYFFDSPSYTALSAASHKVSGPGVVVETCRDCGEVLLEETVDNAEEIRPHSMKKGVCALCGYRTKTEAKQDRKDSPGERTLVAQPDGNGLFFLTLTEQDLAALAKAKVTTLLVRGERGKAEIAIDVKEIRQEVVREAASFSVEMAEREDGSLFAGLSISNAPGKKAELDLENAFLRFYEDEDTVLKVALDLSDTEKLLEMYGDWDDHGYWTVPYVGEGYYMLIR